MRPESDTAFLKKFRGKSGFTLLELLIVIAIIAIIAAVAFVSLDPLTRFRDARDSRRWADVAGLASAIKIDQVDNRGRYLNAIQAMTTGSVYMIGTATSGCDDQNAFCDTDVANDTACVNLTGLVNEGYLAQVPTSPNGDGTWTSGVTGYTLMTSTTGALFVRSCESENTTEIFIGR